MTPELVRRIMPLATVYGSQTINPLTAPPAVIAALPGIDQGGLQAFLEARRISPVDTAQLLALLAPAQPYLEVKPPSAVAVSLEATLTRGFGAAARSVIVALREDTQPYRVLAWDPLPAYSP
jgi:general secretion pathway protein K